jgi:hypothetical protein
MKKKIINGIMMVALVAATSTSFVSCKDTNEDVKIELQQDYTNLLTKLATLEKQYGDLGKKVSDLETKVKNHSEDIAVLQLEVDALEDWLIETFNNLVLGANIEATYTNLTGSINIPGAEPFMLISNYGTTTAEGKFPAEADKNGNQLSWAANEELGTGKDAEIDFTKDGDITVTLNGGFAGYMYASVNRFFNDQKLQDKGIDENSVFSFSLVNSAGEPVDGLLIANADPDGAATNDILKWGWTRAENNMFKFGVAYAGDQAEKFQPAKLDLSKFKDDLKQVWRDRNRATGTSKQALGHLAADLYYNLLTKDTNLAKYRLKIAWEDNFEEAAIEKEYKIVPETAESADIIQEDTDTDDIKGKAHYVTANGDIVFAMYKPLSFNSGEALAEQVSKGVATTNHVIEKSEVLWNKIFDKIKAQFPNMNPNQIQTIIASGTLKNGAAPAPEWFIDIDNDGWTAAKDVDLSGVINPLNTTLANVQDMLAQANAAIAKLNGSTVTNWLEKFTNKFDNLFKNNAQQILEPVLLAIDKQGNVNRISGIKAAPLVVDGEVTVDPTSYSSEVFAPAYAKIVSCEDIEEDGFNEILFANDKDLKFTPESGKTYELTYEAVDFFGNTRSHKYYIQGK